MRLANKRAIVTGGARGIGRATVEKLLAEGARVAFLDIDASAGAQTVNDLTGAGDVRFLPCDVTKLAEVEAAIAETAAGFGGLDILINNAGINAYYDAAAMNEAAWEHVFAVDLKGAWLCTKQAIPILERGNQSAIVNVASIHAFMTIEGMFPYAAAKSGIVGLTRSLALDLGPRGIRVNAICPGWTNTDLVAEWFDMQPEPAASRASVDAVHALRRIATPAEIANVIAFLASDEASFVTGAAWLVDGGLSARFAT